MVRAVFLALLLAMVMQGVALACPPPPPPPMQRPDEAAEAYQVRLDALHAQETAALNERLRGYQRQWWGEAHAVLVVRVERVGTVAMRDAWGGGATTSPRVYLRPVRWLKGAGPSRGFLLHYTGMSDCGPYGGGDAVTGHVGEEFVVFVRDGRPSQNNVITSIAMDRILDEDLRSRVAQPAAH